MSESQTVAVGRRRWLGIALIAVGVAHSLFGIVFMGSTLRIIAAEGFFNTVHGQPAREAAFWFFYSGFALMILGGVVDWIESRGLTLPEFLPWTFLAITAAGVFIMPASGFWLLFPPVIGMFLRQRAKQEAETA